MSSSSPIVFILEIAYSFSLQASIALNSLLSYFAVADDDDVDDGAIQVSENSVAARCGLRPGDIVVRLCGQSADRMTHLMAQQTIASCRETLEIIVERFASAFQNT